MFALVTGFPLFIGLVKGSISFLCLISVTPIMLLLSGRSHVRCLYTVLLALSGSCSFILVLCGVEFVAQGESYLSELGYIIAHSAYSAVYQYVRIVGFKRLLACSCMLSRLLKNALYRASDTLHASFCRYMFWLWPQVV